MMEPEMSSELERALFNHVNSIIAPLAFKKSEGDIVDPEIKFEN